MKILWLQNLSLMTCLICANFLFLTQFCLKLCQDERIPLGLPAADLQAPILMYMECKVKLIDHEFEVGPQDKLIPCVYGICEVAKPGAISCSGNIIIRVRSVKHETSNNFAHAHDARELFQGEVVTILRMETDGVQNEAPRYLKTCYYC